MTETPKLQDFIGRNYKSDFIRKHKHPDGSTDFFVSVLTAEYFERTFGLKTVDATNEGRTNPLDLSLFNKQLVLEGKGGLYEQLGGKKSALVILELVEKPMMPEPLARLRELAASGGYAAQVQAGRARQPRGRGHGHES
jgi:hypothetical protein